jgi:FkbM family methyltransferase
MYNPSWLRFCKRVVRAGLGVDHLLMPDLGVKTLRLGSAYGGWSIAPEPLESVAQPIVLSFGLGDDISFDQEVASRFGAKVYGFDPTPMSLNWLEHAQKPDSMEIYPIGIAKVDGVQVFSGAPDDKRGNFSMKAEEGSSVTCRVMTYRSILDMIKVTRPDVLKIDIEGAEYDVIPDILKSDLPTQLLVEFHHRLHSITVSDTLGAVSAIKEAGYQLISVSPSGQEMSFLLAPRQPDAASAEDQFAKQNASALGETVCILNDQTVQSK